MGRLGKLGIMQQNLWEWNTDKIKKNRFTREKWRNSLWWNVNRSKKLYNQKLSFRYDGNNDLWLEFVEAINSNQTTSEIIENKYHYLLYWIQFIAFGEHGILGQHVVRHVVKVFKYEPEKCKVMKEMMGFHVPVFHLNRKAVT